MFSAHNMQQNQIQIMKIEPNINYFAVLLSRMLAVFTVLLLMKVCANGILQNTSWWWITLPLWLPVLLALVYLMIVFIAWFFVRNEFPDDEIL